MTRDEWIKFNDDKEGKRCNGTQGRERYHPTAYAYSILNKEVYDPDHGIFLWAYDDAVKVLFVNGVIGDHKYWIKYGNHLAKALGANKIVAYAPTKNPKALERLYGAKVSRIFYEFEREVK